MQVNFCIKFIPGYTCSPIATLKYLCGLCMTSSTNRDSFLGQHTLFLLVSLTGHICEGYKKEYKKLN